MSDFTHLKVGDTVTRMLAGTIPQQLKVTEVKETSVICELWEFDRASGAEIDDYLQWGPKYGITGSFLINPK